MPPRFRLPAAIVAVLVVAGAACSSGDVTVAGGGDPGPTSSVPVQPETTGPPDPLHDGYTPAPLGDLVAWSMAGGECRSCGFDLRLDADGRARYRPDLGRATTTFDVAMLRELLDDLDPAALVTGTDDCGREVDGNAPSLTLYRDAGEPLVIDDCYSTVDRDHPLMAFVLDVLDDAEARVVPTVAEVIVHGGRCPTGACRTVVTVFGDGTWTRTDEAGSATEGVLTAAETERLVASVDGATRAALVTGPFAGECPTAHDGQARAYVLYPSPAGDESAGSVHLDTCRDEIDVDATVVSLLDGVLASASAD